MLRHLNLQNCQHLKSILLIAPKLESFNASNCPHLHTISIDSKELRYLNLPATLALTQLQLSGSARWQSDWGTASFENNQFMPRFQRAWFLLGLTMLFHYSIYGFADKEQALFWFKKFISLHESGIILLNLKKEIDKIKFIIAFLSVEPKMFSNYSFESDEIYERFYNLISSSLLISKNSEIQKYMSLKKSYHMDSYQLYRDQMRQVIQKQLFLYLAQEDYINEMKLLSSIISQDIHIWLQQNELGDTAIHLAIKNNCYSVIEYACQQKVVALQIQNNDGNTPFLEAAYLGHIKSMQKLLDAFPEAKLWTQQNKDGNTALHLALKKNNDSILALACQCITDLTESIILTEIAMGNTIFLEAVHRGKITFMQKLLEAFPEENFWLHEDSKGNTALDIAKQKNDRSILELASDHSVLVTQFGLFQKSTAEKFCDHDLKSIQRIICNYLGG